MALAATFGDKPQAMNMSFQWEYAESYDWLTTQFKDWAFTFVSRFLYYEDYDKIDETTRDLYRQEMAVFGGIAPTYHIALYDKPTIVWDFYSLLLGVQMMFSFMLTDNKKPLRCLSIAKRYLWPDTRMPRSVLPVARTSTMSIRAGRTKRVRIRGANTRLKRAKTAFDRRVRIYNLARFLGLWCNKKPVSMRVCGLSQTAKYLRPAVTIDFFDIASANLSKE